MAIQSSSADTSFSSVTLDAVRNLNHVKLNDLTPGTVPEVRIGDQGKYLCFTPQKDAPETREERLDKKIKSTFGEEVFDHLKDWNWLIKNRKMLEDGFKKLEGDDRENVAKRLQELISQVSFGTTSGGSSQALEINGLKMVVEKKW